MTTVQPYRAPGDVVRVTAPPRWWAGVATWTAVFSVTVVVVLWVANQGLADLAGSAGATSLGRLTGLVAADLLVVQVLLMARIPVVERSYGLDGLARRHRLVGFWSFWLMIAHVLLTIVGYSVPDNVDVLHETWSMVTTFPGMLLATAGTFLLIAVVALSIRSARRRLRYESWHLLHLYAYLGVGLALPHEIWTGTDFIASAWSRVYWWTLYAVTLAAVLVFRVAVPVWRSAYHRLEVSDVVVEAPGVVSVYLRGRHLERMPVRAGQFFLWRFLDGPGWTRAHPYTLSAPPRTDQLRITVKDVGDGSQRLGRLRPGTRVFVEGPFGTLTGAGRRQPKVLALAAGVGITPMRALLEDLDFAPGGATLIYRTRRAEDVLFRSELDSLAVQRGVTIVYLDGPRSPTVPWLPERLSHLDDVTALRSWVPDLDEREVYLCGPLSWMDSVRDTLARAELPADRVHAEEFSW